MTWRQNALQKEINQPASNSSLVKNVKLLPLGDLSIITKIVEDTRNLVVANNLPGAKTRVVDLEYEWDNAQSRLKPMNGAKWTEVDNAINKVLRQIRAVNSNQQDCKSALDNLLIVLK